MSLHRITHAPSRRRPALLVALALLVVGLLTPATASAYTAPVLASGSGTNATEGQGITFDWSGGLQGDPSAISRSFFRVELAVKDDNPIGQQAAWTRLTNYSITDAGDSTTTLQMGAPKAGTYEWRVCAWGVANANVDPAVEQLICSPARTVAIAAATAPTQSSTVLTQTTTHTVTTAPTHVTKTILLPAPAVPAPKITRIAVPHKDPHGVARFEKSPVKAPTYGDKGSSSSVSLGNEGLNAGSNASGAGAFGFISRGLGSTIPGLPIPFWSLLIFLLVAPLTHLWRRSLVGMFEWPEERDAMANDVDGPAAG